ncbi:S-adenosylmethionine transporter [Agyrium rufum]|nr:S-adenosylmethionine transporter [Agyrium rufum]
MPISVNDVGNPYTKALLAGAMAGTTVDLSLYPIDTLKTRLQSSKGFIAAGGFRGIYAGVGSVVIGSAPGAALFFVTYESIKVSLLRSSSDSYPGAPQLQNKWTEPLIHMAAASAGEVAACAVRVPTEVVKQRAQAIQYRSSLEALQAIMALRSTLGFRGVWSELYRGWGVTVMREVPFTVIQFPLWEAMKEWRRRTAGKDDITPIESAIFGSAAGAVAAGVTTPLDVLKTRIMLSTGKVEVWPLLSHILKTSGPRAFFAGLGPRVLWISAGGAVFLGSYQWAYNALGPVTFNQP